MDVEEDLISSYRTTFDSFSSVFSLFLDLTQETWQNESASISYSSIVQKKKVVKPSFDLFFCFVFCKLTIVEICIETTLIHKLFMIALLDDVSFFHDQNQVSIADRWQTVGDDIWDKKSSRVIPQDEN